MDYSDDEALLLVLALVIAGFSVYRFWVPVVNIRLMRPWPGRAALAAAWAGGLAILLCILLEAAARDVREDGSYVFLFMTVGIAWQGITLFLMRALGISWLADALERRNAAALCAVAGGLLGSSILFALANIGEGDTIWTTIGPACVAMMVWLAAWAILEAVTRCSEDVAVERDIASGLRLGAMLLANGLVLGRAAAGDWEGCDAMFRDFAAQGWPVVLITGMAMVLQWQWQPAKRRQMGLRTAAIIPAALMLLVGALWLWILGAPR